MKRSKLIEQDPCLMNYLPGDNIMTKLKQNTSQLQVLV